MERHATEIRRRAARPWIWSDYAWHHPDLFYARMPHRILQSNWYYGETFDAPRGDHPRRLDEGEGYLTYPDLDDHGYDQVPTARTCVCLPNFGSTVDYCSAHVGAERLLGYLQVPWRRTVAEFRDIHLTSIDLVREAKEAYEKARS